MGLEEMAQQLLGIVHGSQELGVQVSDAGGGHRLQHPCRNVAGPRPHEKPIAGIKIFEILGVDGDESALMSKLPSFFKPLW